MGVAEILILIVGVALVGIGLTILLRNRRLDAVLIGVVVTVIGAVTSWASLTGLLT